MRSKLTVKYPTEVYTKDAYPFLEDDYDQTLVGYCFGYMCGIPATPTNGKQIYDSSNAKIQWTDYHIPPNWKSITKIEILMEDTWVEVYPGLGNPYDITYTTRNPQPVKMFPETGLFQVYSSQARGLNSNGSVINYANSPQKCRVFCEYDKGTVRESIKFLLDLANTPELSDNFDGEFDGLYYSNLYLNQSKSIFEWIETIQSGNIIGGQLLLQQDRIFFKLENPNRPRLLDIGKHEALNHEDLSVSIAKDFFYSGYDISYKKAYIGDNQDGHFSGVFGRNPQPDVYTGTDNTVRLVYRSPTDQGYDTTYIQKRISILRDLATAQRHKVSGLRVPLTQKYMDIELYDVIGYIPFILEGTALPMMEWTVYGKTVLMGSEGNCIQLDLIERVTTTAWDGTPLTN